MHGFIIFDDKNSVIYIHCDENLQDHILDKQTDLCLALYSTSSGYSETEEEKETSEGKAEVQKTENSETSVKKDEPSSSYDYNVLTQLFLPIVVLSTAKNQLDADPYLQFASPDGFKYSFHHLKRKILILFI